MSIVDTYIEFEQAAKKRRTIQAYIRDAFSEHIDLRKPDLSDEGMAVLALAMEYRDEITDKSLRGRMVTALCRDVDSTQAAFLLKHVPNLDLCVLWWVPEVFARTQGQTHTDLFYSALYCAGWFDKRMFSAVEQFIRDQPILPILEFKKTMVKIKDLGRWFVHAAVPRLDVTGGLVAKLLDHFANAPASDFYLHALIVYLIANNPKWLSDEDFAAIDKYIDRDRLGPRPYDVHRPIFVLVSELSRRGILDPDLQFKFFAGHLSYFMDAPYLPSILGVQRIPWYADIRRKLAQQVRALLAWLVAASSYAPEIAYIYETLLPRPIPDLAEELLAGPVQVDAASKLGELVQILPLDGQRYFQFLLDSEDLPLDVRLHRYPVYAQLYSVG